MAYLRLTSLTLAYGRLTLLFTKFSLRDAILLASVVLVFDRPILEIVHDAPAPSAVFVDADYAPAIEEATRRSRGS